MAYAVNLAPQAMADLDSIFEAINAEHSQAAAEWYRHLETAILSLEHLPSRCSSTPERPNLRHLLFGNKPHVYRIIFSVDEARLIVNVAQIRHGARRPMRR